MKKVFTIFFCLFLFSFAVLGLSRAEEIKTVAVFPFSVNSSKSMDYVRDGVWDMLISRISADGRINVVDKYAVTEALGDMGNKKLSAEDTCNVGKKLGADYVVLGSITEIGNTVSLDGKLFDVNARRASAGVFEQCDGMGEIISKVGDFSKKISSSIFEQRPKVVSAVPVFDVSKDQVAPQPEKPVPAKALTTDSDSIALVVPPKEPPAERQVAKEGFWMSRRYPIEFKGMDIGDVNRDGLNEVVLIDDKNIMIYRKDSGELKFVDKIEGRSYGRNLAVDVADINKNGVSEIIVTSINEPSKRLNSFVFEYRDGKFTQIASGLEWFMRVINSASGDPLLIGQRQGLDSPFELPIYKIVWKNKEYKEGGKIAVPRGLSVYGLTMCNLGDSRSERVVALDDYDHLCVYTKTNKPLSKIHIIGGGDELIWKSLDVFGGTSNYFEPEDDSNANDTETETPDNVLINVRIIPFDADGDGKKEIAIVRNMSPGGRVFQNVRVFTKGEVCCLEWDGLGLSEIFKTKQIQGYIADYQLKDIDNDGRDELITVVKLSRNKSIVAVYGFGKERAN